MQQVILKLMDTIRQWFHLNLSEMAYLCKHLSWLYKMSERMGHKSEQELETVLSLYPPLSISASLNVVHGIFLSACLYQTL